MLRGIDAKLPSPSSKLTVDCARYRRLIQWRCDRENRFHRYFLWQKVISERHIYTAHPRVGAKAVLMKQRAKFTMSTTPTTSPSRFNT